MNKVVFPTFNLEFEFSPIAIEFGNLQIYWYSICIVSGIVISLILMYFSNKKHGIKYEQIIEIMIFTLIFGIIGARIFYVVFNLDYYLNNISEIFNIKGGGLAIFGGIIAGAITAYILCKRSKINFLDFCDYLVPYLALSQAIGRIGNFFNIEAYGIETNNIFRMGIETISGYTEVHPCFLYEMIGCLLIFIILKILESKQLCYENNKKNIQEGNTNSTCNIKKVHCKGEIFSFYLILYGTIRFLIEGVRADSLMLLNIRISQLIAIIMVIFGISIYINNIKCRKNSNNVD